jgi:hypothetical protein
MAMRENDGGGLRMFVGQEEGDHFRFEHADRIQSASQIFAGGGDVVQDFRCLGWVEGAHQRRPQKIEAGNAQPASADRHAFVEIAGDFVYCAQFHFAEGGHVVSDALDFALFHFSQNFGRAFFTQRH